MKKLLLNRNKAMPEDLSTVENNPLPDFRQASLASYRSFLEDDSLDSSSPFCIPRKSKLLEMFPSPCSIIDSDSDSRVLSSSVAPVAPVKLVLPPILSTTPPAETVKVPPTPPKIKKVRRRKCTLRILLPDGVTSLDNLASTSTPPEWAAHFKKADFGTDYTLRPRIERPRYDFPSDEAVDVAITAASCPSRRKSKNDPSSPSKPAVKRRAVRSRGPKRRAAMTAKEIYLASLGFPDSFKKLITAASFANGIHCVCSSSLDIGPQIECEKCGLWQHMFCVEMSGKDTEGYVCDNCSGNLEQEEPYDSEEALKAFSAYASSLPVTKDEQEEEEEGEEQKEQGKNVRNVKRKKRVVGVRKCSKRPLALSGNPRRKPGRPPRVDLLTKLQPSPLLLRAVSAETSMTSEPETPAALKEKPVCDPSKGAAAETTPAKFPETPDLNSKKKINLKVVHKQTKCCKTPLLTANPIPEFYSITIAGEVSHTPKNIT